MKRDDVRAADPGGELRLDIEGISVEVAVIAAVAEDRYERFGSCASRFQRWSVDLHEDGRSGVSQKGAGSGEKLRFATFNIELDENTAGEFVKREKIIEADERDRGCAVEGDGGVGGMEAAGTRGGTWHV